MYFIVSKSKNEEYGILNDKTGVIEYHDRDKVLELSKVVRIKGVSRDSISPIPLYDIAYSYSKYLFTKFNTVANCDVALFDIIKKYNDYCKLIGYEDKFNYFYNDGLDTFSSIPFPFNGDIYIDARIKDKKIKEITSDFMVPYFVRTYAELFSCCYNLKKVVLGSSFNNSLVVRYDEMFSSCYSLTEIDCSSLNDTNVVSMIGMFFNCYSLERLDLSNLTFKSCSCHDSMFYKCSSLKYLNLSGLISELKVPSNEVYKGCHHDLVYNFKCHNSYEVDLLYKDLGITGD